MPNFWDNIGQNSNNKTNIKELLNFIRKNRGKSLEQMLKEYNINASQEDINNIIPQAKEIMKMFNLK